MDDSLRKRLGELEEQLEEQRQIPQWEMTLDEREQKEVDFCRLYASRFAHGTAGHNRLMLIAKLARMLDAIDQEDVDVGSDLDMTGAFDLLRLVTEGVPIEEGERRHALTLQEDKLTLAVSYRGEWYTTEVDLSLTGVEFAQVVIGTFENFRKLEEAGGYK